MKRFLLLLLLAAVLLTGCRKEPTVYYSPNSQSIRERFFSVFYGDDSSEDASTGDESSEEQTEAIVTPMMDFDK